MADEPINDRPKAVDVPARLLLSELIWVALDEETTAGQHGLTPLLLQRFGQQIPALELERSRNFSWTDCSSGRSMAITSRSRKS